MDNDHKSPAMRLIQEKVDFLQSEKETAQGVMERLKADAAATTMLIDDLQKRIDNLQQAIHCLIYNKK